MLEKFVKRMPPGVSHSAWTKASCTTPLLNACRNGAVDAPAGYLHSGIAEFLAQLGGALPGGLDGAHELRLDAVLLHRCQRSVSGAALGGDPGTQLLRRVVRGLRQRGSAHKSAHCEL